MSNVSSNEIFSSWYNSLPDDCKRFVAEYIALRLLCGVLNIIFSPERLKKEGDN